MAKRKINAKEAENNPLQISLEETFLLRGANENELSGFRIKPGRNIRVG